MRQWRRAGGLRTALLGGLLILACGCSSSAARTAPTTSVITVGSPVTRPTTTPLPTSPGVTGVTSTGTAGASTAGSGAASTAPPPTDAFVTAQGRQFLLAGRPFRFVGANIYDAAASDRYSCRAGSRMSDAVLAQTLKYLRDQAGATVIRFWAYQTYTQGATHFDGMDRVIAAARTLGMKVLPVLEDGPGNCTTVDPPVAKSDYDGDTWYTQGYKVPFGNATLSYRDYVRTVVGHYANEPTILGWSMMNEADTNARDEFGRPALLGFATDMAAVIKAADPHHLVTVGTQSNGAPGASGPDFTAVYGVRGVDFAEVHDWAAWGSDTEPMPGGTGLNPPAATDPACQRPNAKIGCSFALAVALDKPLVVGEAGIAASDAAQRATRARLMGAKMDAAFQAGAAGYLVWSVTLGITDGYDILIDSGDPLIGQMSAVAHSLIP